MDEDRYFNTFPSSSAHTPYPNYHNPHIPESQPNFYVPQNVPGFVDGANTNTNHRGYDESRAFSSHTFIPNSAVTGMAMHYGSSVMGHGADFVQKNVSSYLSTSRVKYYFAVNNSYVAKKLGLIVFPFAQTKWSTQFDPMGPVPPGDDLNAPDLYIPLMAFITYILASGAIMGFQGRFSPEQLGVLSSEALGWFALEVIVFLFCIYILNIQSNISYLDLMAFSGYKFVSMIVVLLAYILLDQSGYYFSLTYVSLALAFFLIRTLKLKVLPHAEAYPSEGNKRRVYLLLVIALVQPVIMWWLTRRMLVVVPTVSTQV
ncbi:hypothetical protein AHF37_00189 [Paragonimus kellicotti]|nr:hypothetical protein AHF37_00189 [Paragonimus kellicotti]